MVTGTEMLSSAIPMPKPRVLRAFKEAHPIKSRAACWIAGQDIQAASLKPSTA